MKSNTRRQSRVGRAVLLCGILAVLATMPLGAQGSPPGRGTIAPEDTIDKFYRAANVVLVATVDGLRHVYHLARDFFVPPVEGPDPFDGLLEGTTVLIRYPVARNGEGRDEPAQDHADADSTEGIVTRIDRAHRQLAIRYDNGRTETFQLAGRAADLPAAGPAAAQDGQVVIYYANGTGQRIPHLFDRREAS